MNLRIPDFESLKHENEQGQPYWSARELSEKLGYAKNWRGFEKAASERIHQKDTKDLPRAFDLRKELEARRCAAQKQISKTKQAEEGGQQSLF